MRRDLVIIGNKCRAPWCPTCGKAYWGKVWFKIKPHLHLFKRARLLTFTIDPKNFISGEQAYKVIEGKQKYIKRFLRLMGFKKAFKVMAFHTPKESRPDANNWPHYHLVVDLDDIKGRVDLKRGWHLWREKWGIGGFDLQIKRKYRTAEAAVKYAISYCQHQSTVVADWALDAKRAPRCYEMIGDLRKAVSRERKTVERVKEILDDEREEVIVKLYQEGSYLGDRINKCSSGSVVLLRERWGNFEKFKYVGNILVSPEKVALFEKFGMPGVVVEKKEFTSMDSISVFYPLTDSEDEDVGLIQLCSLVDEYKSKCGIEDIPI